MASPRSRPALTIMDSETRKTTQDSGAWKDLDNSAPRRRCILTPAAADIETKETIDSRFHLTPETLAGSYRLCHGSRGQAASSCREGYRLCHGARGRAASSCREGYRLCHGARGRAASSCREGLTHSSTFDTYNAHHSVTNTVYHQKFFLPSQHSMQNKFSGESNSTRREATYYPMSLIFEYGSVSPKCTLHYFACLRAIFFAFLLLSNCLVSSASKLDSATLRGTRRLGNSVPGTAWGSTPNTSPHSGTRYLFTNTDDNSMRVVDVREISIKSNRITQRDILHQSNADARVTSSSGAVSTSQDNVQPSFYRSSMLYASDGSSSRASSDPNINNSSESQSKSSDTNSGTSSYTPTGRPLRAPDSCEVSNIKCALRTGCGMALQKYMLDCADLISGHTDGCDSHCRDSLLILTSTSEGRALMDCVCSNDYCRATKARLEVCRAQVLSAGAQDGALSCRLAHLVCTADTLCATAIAYYDKFCRRMFIGRSCSPRCNNSIAILQRQQQASRLETCHCDGSEPFACADIKSNMARLCFHQVDPDDREKQEEETNEIDTSPVGGRGPASKSGAVGGTTPSHVISRLLLMSLLMSVIQYIIHREGR